MKKLALRLKGDNSPRHTTRNAPPLQFTDEFLNTQSNEPSPRRLSTSSDVVRSLSSLAQSTTLAYEDALTSGLTRPSARRARASSMLNYGDTHNQLMLMMLQNTTDVGCSITPRTLAIERDTYPLMDYLFVSGFTQSTDNKVSVLAKIPSATSVEAIMASFCFPDKSPICEQLNGTTQMDTIAFDNRQGGQSTFMFCVNSSSTSPSYAFVVRNIEVLEDPATWMPSDCVKRNAITAPRHFTERAYCIVSRNPYARLFWTLLWEFTRIEHERLTTPDVRKRDRCQKRLAAFVNMIVAFCTTTYSPGKALVIENRACFSTGTIEYKLPHATHSSRVIIACICLPVLLRALSPANIASLLCAILIESKVVIIGKHPGRVATCVLALISSIAPFAWQGALMPLMPHSMIDFVEVPSPLVAGWISDSVDLPNTIEYSDNERVVVVCVDKNSIRIHGPPLPQLPCAFDLIASLLDAHLRLRTTRVVSNGMCEDPFPFTPLDEKTSAQVFSAIEAFNQYTVWLIDSIRKLLPNHCYPEDTPPEDPTYYASLLMRIDQKHTKFIESLFNAQHYQFIARTFADMPPPGITTIGAYTNAQL